MKKTGPINDIGLLVPCEIGLLPPGKNVEKRYNITRPII